jgi:CDP-diacylglycerol--serine O-phosphatidyltransferase
MIQIKRHRIRLPHRRVDAPGAGDAEAAAPGRFRRFGHRRPSREKVFAVLPTLLTLGNAMCGFGSITFAAKVGPEPVTGNPLFVAGLLIFLAMLFDMLDGHMARLMKQSSNFGAELDSLCDAISFGVAPAFLMLKFPQVYHPRFLWVIAVLFVVCAVLRLARFNVETDDEDAHEFFSGLPSPAAAAMVASFAVAMPLLVRMMDPSQAWINQQIGYYLIEAIPFGLPFVTLTVACLMVSRVRYPHVWNQWFRGRHNFRHLVQAVFAMVVIITLPEFALPLILGYFVLASPLRALWGETAQRRSASAAAAVQAEPAAQPTGEVTQELPQ